MKTTIKPFTMNKMIFLDSVGSVIDKDTLMIYPQLQDGNGYDELNGVHIDEIDSRDDWYSYLTYADKKIVELILDK